MSSYNIHPATAATASAPAAVASSGRVSGSNTNTTAPQQQQQQSQSHSQEPLYRSNTTASSPYAGLAAATSDGGHGYGQRQANQEEVDLQQRQQQQQQQQQQQYAQESSYPHPAMYAVPHSSRSVNQIHNPKPSLDVPESVIGQDDGASIHSRSALNQPGHGGSAFHARFDSTQFPIYTSSTNAPPQLNSIRQVTQQPVGSGGVKEADYVNEKVAGGPGVLALNGGAGKEQRSLPQGYHTPPAFSRRTTSGNSTPATAGGGSGTPNTNYPYGTLGGAASKSDTAFQFAEADVKSPFARFWLSVLEKNIVVRWLVFICPVLLLLWIPGICGVTIDPTPTVWHVSLLNWSIWLTIAWLGWWGSVAVAMVLPHVLKATFGVVAPESKHYIDYLYALKKSLAGFMWTLAMWISFQPLILLQGPSDRSRGTGLTLSQMTKGLFAFWICAIILLIEKFLIQVIAYNFHRTSYADRIADNKTAVRALTQLYLNSRDIGRNDTLDGARTKAGRERMDPSKLVKKTLKSAKRVVTGTTTALGTVASEIVGERVLQSNSPSSMVVSALSSANKSRQLARRLFFSFTPSSRDAMLLEDILPYFQSREQAVEVFSLFDKDDNGDATLDEMEMACLEIHRERLSLSSSMHDLDSAVGRLDQILMSVYYVVAILIIIGLLNVSFSGFITSASAFILGLSWLIGSTSQEVLAAVVFLLAKHPYDVGDLIAIDGFEGGYVVREISLLSTVFKRTDGQITQIPHTVLNTKAIHNYRRSGPTSESFTWSVDFGTSFEQIESLRDAMLDFLEYEKRDFLPECDISVNSFEDQSKITLSTSIPYKSNWSNAAQKSQRRNKWICALKIAMAELQIYGPGGAGNPSPAPADPTVIKLLNPEAASAAAPPYRPTASSSTGASSEEERTRLNATTSPLQQQGQAGTGPSPSPASPSPPLNLAAEVGRLGLVDRHRIVTDERTDVFDYQGDANRDDSLGLAEVAQHPVAQTHPHSRDTASQGQAANEGDRSTRFRQRDLELGKLHASRQQQKQQE